MKTKQKLSKEAIALLRKVQKTITEEPMRLNMGTWGKQDAEETTVLMAPEMTPQDGGEVKVKLPPCGTVGCIAGWTAICGLPKSSLPTIVINGNIMVDVTEIGNVEFAARKLLGITEKQAESLFYLPTWEIAIDGNVEAWPVKFANAYAKAKTPEAKAKVACERIDYFIEHLA